jgi:hypothetical protein
MVNKLVARLLVIILILGAVVLVCQDPNPVQLEDPHKDEKVILEMTMYPIQDSEGEYMLEYRESTHGPVIRREILKKDGKRYPVGNVGAVSQVEKK